MFSSAKKGLFVCVSCIYLFFLTNKKALMSLFLHGLFLLKAGKEEAVKVLFVSLCRRRFGLCYKSFYVHVELLFAHILSCDSFLPLSSNWFITSYLPSRGPLS